MQSVHDSNHIDLTLDDDDDHSPSPPNSNDHRLAKRPRTDAHQAQLATSYPFHHPLAPPHPPTPPLVSPSPFAPYPGHHQHQISLQHHLPFVQQQSYRPLFAGPAASYYQQHRPPPSASPPPSRTPSAASTSFVPLPLPLPQSQDKHVIDLTGSPSPPPPLPRQSPISHMQAKVMAALPEELPPRTPVCIGQLAVNALILYPVSYLTPTRPPEADWAWVRVVYDGHAPRTPNSRETIEVRTPNTRHRESGQVIPGERFGVVEQKAADHLGPMLSKGLIRLDAKIRRCASNLPILPMQVLVYTPKGNIPVVGNYLKTCDLLLDHPSVDFETEKASTYHYFNPHEPPLGGFKRNNTLFAQQHAVSTWTSNAPSGKNVEIQRAQAEELFKTTDAAEELRDTEPAPEVATKLYPHQKKALTFLLDREREQPSHSQPDQPFISLWKRRQSKFSNHISWHHSITQKEEFKEPSESKGAILADDMGLGKTITCVSLIAATLQSALDFSLTPLDPVIPPPERQEAPDASHFAGSVWGMPDTSTTPAAASKAKAKAEREQDKLEAEFIRNNRIKIKSRATLIVCPLSTVANWEDQFREHWRGEVTVVGGNAANAACPTPSGSQSTTSSSSSNAMQVDGVKSEDAPPTRVRQGKPLRIYIYHGNARRPDPAFLADFDAVITTYATLASEWSKQTKSLQGPDEDDEDDGDSEDLATEIDDFGNQVIRLPKSKKKGGKRKKINLLAQATGVEQPSALQSVHWFRIVLDEAHSIKEASTVASRACCDLIADRRLCLTGTPVQNKIDDVFALIKFLRIQPFDDKNTWTELIGNPIKFAHDGGFLRLQLIMQCITLRRTKESKSDGKAILELPPRQEITRRLLFSPEELEVYGRFFQESKTEFQDLSKKNEVMKNYVGILQNILRLRQICDHYDLVKGKDPNGSGSGDPLSYEALSEAIQKEGLTPARATGIFTILREAAMPQCFQCGCDFCANDSPNDIDDDLGASTSTVPAKRGRKPKALIASGTNTPRGPTRVASPLPHRPILTRCQHLFCFECFRSYISPSWPTVAPDVPMACSACQTALASADAIEVRPDAVVEPPTKKRATQKRERRQKTEPSESFKTSTKIMALIGDLIESSRHNPHSANYTDDCVLLPEQDTKPVNVDVVKTVVFSQWTSMLDKVEEALDNARIRYERLDGTMKRDERTRAMDALKYDPACEVLLVSLRAGGVGLNLTAAQRVYLLDPYWNPAVENQALDRVHRLGQTKPVTAIKFIMENSIEDRLLDIQKRKIELANMTVNRPQTKAELLERRLRDLEELFTVTGGSIKPQQQAPSSLTGGLFGPPSLQAQPHQPQPPQVVPHTFQPPQALQPQPQVPYPIS